MSEPPQPPAEAPAGTPTETKERLSDGQALAALGAWLVFRALTQRVGIGLAPKLLKQQAWAIPLLNNSMVLLITTGTATRGRPAMFVASALTSVVMSTIAGLILYWAGGRFGHKLAELSAQPGSAWAGVWNPKQIARAERWLEGWGLAVIFLARVIEFFTVPVMLVAGATSMRFRRFIAAHTAGAVAFAVIFLWVGGVAQGRWPWLKDWITNVLGPWALRIGLGLLVLFVLLTLVARATQRSGAESPDGETDQPSKTIPSQGPSSSGPPTD